MPLAAPVEGAQVPLGCREGWILDSGPYGVYLCLYSVGSHVGWDESVGNLML